MESEKSTIRFKADKKACLSPCLNQLGWAIFSEPVHDAENLPGHTHRGSFEICYLDRGTVDWWVEDKQYHIKPGHVFVTFPGEKHGGLYDIMNPCQLYWAQIAMPKGKAIGGLTVSETRLIAKELASLEERMFPASRDVVSCFERLIDEHQLPSAHSKIAIRSTLVQLLVSVLRSCGSKAGGARKGPRISGVVKKACAIINQNLSSNLKVDAIARKVDLSTTAFYQQFAEQLHLTPAEYVTQRRIEWAKELLADESLSITAIAHRLGYSSSQYFATIFKRSTGISPTQFRK